MKPEQVLDKHCRFDAMSINFKRRVISAMEEFARIEVRKAGEPKPKKFQPSLNGIKLSALIERKFGIELQPRIHRRYVDNDKVKFEMKDTCGNEYYFEDLVKDFLVPDITIQLDGRIFLIE